MIKKYVCLLGFATISFCSSWAAYAGVNLCKRPSLQSQFILPEIARTQETLLDGVFRNDQIKIEKKISGGINGTQSDVFKATLEPSGVPIIVKRHLHESQLVFPERVAYLLSSRLHLDIFGFGIIRSLDLDGKGKRPWWVQTLLPGKTVAQMHPKERSQIAGLYSPQFVIREKIFEYLIKDIDRGSNSLYDLNAGRIYAIDAASSFMISNSHKPDEAGIPDPAFAPKLPQMSQISKAELAQQAELFNTIANLDIKKLAEELQENFENSDQGLRKFNELIARISFLQGAVRKKLGLEI